MRTKVYDLVSLPFNIGCGFCANCERGMTGFCLTVSPDMAGGARRSNLVHWGYGTGWGAVRGVIVTAGLRGSGATAAHFGVLWDSEQVMLPALGVAPPFWGWEAKEVAIDALHHLVYAVATGAAYTDLDRQPLPGPPPPPGCGKQSCAPPISASELDFGYLRSASSGNLYNGNYFRRSNACRSAG